MPEIQYRPFEVKVRAALDNLEARTNPKKTKILYQNLGSKISKMRDTNDQLENEVESEKQKLNSILMRIKEKESLLDEIRTKKIELTGKSTEGVTSNEKKITEVTYNEKKIKENAINFFDKKYEELVKYKNTKIAESQLENDTNQLKVIQDGDHKKNILIDRINHIRKETQEIKSKIDVLRVENEQNEGNLKYIINLKEEQAEEMNKISEEANRYLKEKSELYNELKQLNEKIEKDKTIFEGKIKELNKMIDQTKKLKDYYESIAIEKFSERKLSHEKRDNKVTKSEKKLNELNELLYEKKQILISLNFNRIIWLKKQDTLNQIIEKMKKETGQDTLEKLSEYLELSKKTNELFETDIQVLNEKKTVLEKQIYDIKEEITEVENQVNDNSTKLYQQIDKYKQDVTQAVENEHKYNKKINALNKVIALLSIGFEKVFHKLNFYNEEILESV
jgi:chromosome segregation ATPase